MVFNYYSATKHNEILIIFIKIPILNKLPFICFNSAVQQGMKLQGKNRRKNKYTTMHIKLGRMMGIENSTLPVQTNPTL